MTQIILPNQNITGPNLWSQVEDNDVAIRDVVNGDLGADNLQTGLLPPTGSILQYAGGAAPSGWLLCRGQEVSRTGTYAALFGVVGTAYGVGDGSTTFNLPDLQGRIPVGMTPGGHGSVNALGLDDGTTNKNLRRPAHSHTVSTDGAHTHTGTTDSAGSHTHTVSYGLSGGFSTSQRSATGTDGNDNQSTTTSSNGAHTHTFTTASGGSHTHTVGSTGGTNDAPSFVVVNYIIKV